MPPITVLVADDDACIRHCLRRALEAEPGIEATFEAENGLQAIVMADRHRPVLALLDAEMPRMDGFEAARCLRLRNPDLCIVILSLYEQHRAQALESGADAFVVKDCGCSNLRSLLRSALRERGIELESRQD